MRSHWPCLSSRHVGSCRALLAQHAQKAIPQQKIDLAPHSTDVGKPCTAYCKAQGKAVGMVAMIFVRVNDAHGTVHAVTNCHYSVMGEKWRFVVCSWEV
jgi:hypothetical protein